MTKTSPRPEPLSAHLAELRSRLLLTTGAWLAVSAGIFPFSGRIIDMIASPAGRLYFLAPNEALGVSMTVSLAVGFAIIFPLLVYEAWAFLSPAFDPAVAVALKRWFSIGAGLFLAGGFFGWLVLAPSVFSLLMSFATDRLCPMITAGNYIGFLLNWTGAMALGFELPLAMMILVRAGFIRPQFWSEKRRWAIVIILVVAAFLSPPDAGSMLIMAAPLLILYEVGVFWAGRGPTKTPLKV